MLRGFAKAVLAAWSRLGRPSRRSEPSLFGLEKRTLLSGQVVEKAALHSAPAHHETTNAESRALAIKVNQQAAYVISLYRTYFHRAPDAAELSYALLQLANGVSKSALSNDFKIVVSKTGNRRHMLAS